MTAAWYDRAAMEQPLTQPKRRYTEAEYLAYEEASDTKHEFRDGKIIGMAGGTHGHGIIAVNLSGELRARLRDTPCIVASSDVRVRVSRSYLLPGPVGRLRRAGVRPARSGDHAGQSADRR